MPLVSEGTCTHVVPTYNHTQLYTTENSKLKMLLLAECKEGRKGGIKEGPLEQVLSFLWEKLMQLYPDRRDRIWTQVHLVISCVALGELLMNLFVS